MKEVLQRKAHSRAAERAEGVKTEAQKAHTQRRRDKYSQSNSSVVITEQQKEGERETHRERK